MIDEIVIWRPSGDITAIGHLASRCLLHLRDDLEMLSTNVNYETGSDTIFAPTMRGGMLRLGPPIDSDTPEAGDVLIRFLNDTDVYESFVSPQP